MKRMKTWLQRLYQCCTLKGRKAGSSLGMVMIVGTALVIWVMAIMPLMTTTGTTAIKTQSEQANYITARSSIEYAKSELLYIVESEPPYTFAVIEDSSGAFKAVEKHNAAGGVNPGEDGVSSYLTFVVPGDTDKEDVPRNDEYGNQVAAICAVEPNTANSNIYDITITTFTDGKKNLSYTATYTLNGSLIITPDAYRDNEALPLSDFVLVDGLLGKNDVWTSSITVPGQDVTTIVETLKPWKEIDARGEGYADAGEYPAVLKSRAVPAVSDVTEVDKEIEEDPLTDQQWIVPTAGKGKVGGLWTSSAENGVISLHVEKDAENNSEIIQNKIDENRNYTLYFNGYESTDFGATDVDHLPTYPGTYIISVDFYGSSKYDEDTINLLPIEGLVLGTYEVEGAQLTTQVLQSLQNCEISSIGYNAGTVTVTFDEIDGAQYGYSLDKNGSDIIWNNTNVIELSDAKTYYFYCYMPSSFENGVFCDASDVYYVGMVYPFKTTTELKAGKQYVPLQIHTSSYWDSEKRKMVYVDEYVALSSVNQNIKLSTADFAGKIDDGVLAGNSDLEWTLLNDGGWQFTKDTRDEEESYTAAQYINMSKSGDDSAVVSLNTTSDDSRFSIDFDSGKYAYVYRKIRIIKTTWWGTTQEEDANFYMSIEENGCKASRFSAGKLYFIEVPEQGDASLAKVPGKLDQLFTYNFEYDSPVNGGLYDQILADYENQINLVQLYANGKPVSDTEKLNVGSYELVGKVGDTFVRLGNATVTKSIVTNQLNIAFSVDEDQTDELKVTVKGSNWNGEKGGIRYFGYQTMNDDQPIGEFHWFVSENSEDDSFTFRLPYGKYRFTVAESGSYNYSALSTTTPNEVNNPFVEKEIKVSQINLDDDDWEQFEFAYNPTTGEVTWYKLPKKDGEWKFLPSRIQLVFGEGIGESDIIWSESYEEGKVDFYGVLIVGSQFNDITQEGGVLKIGQPKKITVANGKMSSMLQASSMYFMGGIDTHENNIYLTTDLLVLKNGIIHSTTAVEEEAENGSVIVESYTKVNAKHRKVLVYSVDGYNGFKEKEFYLVPSNTDIAGVTDDMAEAWLIDEDDVEKLFRNPQNPYPEINLDIAYASNSQLACIVSGETMQWTEEGVLLNCNDDTETNTSYIVCAFVSEIEDGEIGEVSRKANRILIASKNKEAGGNSYHYQLTVPVNVRFTTRYLSLDMEALIQEGDVEFIVHNLAQDKSWLLEFIEYFTGSLTDFLSKTLQVDYERSIVIISEEETRMSPQICRYEETDEDGDGELDGINLFTDALNKKELLVVYTDEEIESLFEDRVNIQTTKIVDRYIEIKSERSGTTLDLRSLYGSNTYLYTNYLNIDESIQTLNVRSLNGDFYVSSQETGFRAHDEYLGIFMTGSEESYTGTIVHFEANEVELLYIRYELVGYVMGFPIYKPVDKTMTLQGGDRNFYFIPATNSGMSITKLNDLAETEEEIASGTKPYKLTYDQVKELSSYILEDGSMDGSYVDTGIFDSDSAGYGGFAGGDTQ